MRPVRPACVCAMRFVCVCVLASLHCVPAPPDLQGAVTQVEDISVALNEALLCSRGEAEFTLEIPIMAVTSSSTADPAPIAGHDKQPATVTLMLSSSNHAPIASTASDSPESPVQTAEGMPRNLANLFSECAATAAQEAVDSTIFYTETSEDESTQKHEIKEEGDQQQIVDVMREAAVSAALVAARAAVAAVAGTVFVCLSFYIHM